MQPEKAAFFLLPTLQTVKRVISYAFQELQISYWGHVYGTELIHSNSW